MIKLLERNRKYILGLSGGADSVFLFHFLLEKGINDFIACHVNYNFRKDSYKDLELVQNLCKKNKIKLVVKNISQNYSELRQNFEAWARNERYDFFCEQARKENAEAILIAHNLNDHIETFIMQKNKNKNVSYFGISDRTHYRDFLILRPILNLKKTDIIKRLEEKKIKYIIDSTNFDLKYERNNVRHNLEEKDFSKIMLEIELFNNNLNIYKSAFEENNISSTLDLNLLNDDQRWNEYLIFNFLEKNNLAELIYNNKKSLIKEIIKEIKSEKSFLEILKSNFVIMKDYKILRIIKKSDIEIFQSDNLKYFNDFLIEENISNNKEIIITNDWKKYQAQLIYEGKLLSKLYKNNKTSYLQRYKNVLIFNKTKKIVLNKITI
ncbi:tRNA(Ile)-lysidine synthase [Spiroplasma diminutum CUAS-1]|uniref:tRNA(Ile)-lysidine synthase n=1 Tax=Spiroplasma diminutum CUAS-1 TaxID=1276221 RepID=S5LYU7_9MOLU|nr:tRNA(Ile)-lysidine synthase [Spiroplasma diminutum CUAS-1]